ncbi:hypothetical protein THAOC_12079, partial [Thalassiosira oceanica]
MSRSTLRVLTEPRERRFLRLPHAVLVVLLHEDFVRALPREEAVEAPLLPPPLRRPASLPALPPPVDVPYLLRQARVVLLRPLQVRASDDGVPLLEVAGVRRDPAREVVHRVVLLGREVLPGPRAAGGVPRLRPVPVLQGGRGAAAVPRGPPEHARGGAGALP